MTRTYGGSDKLLEFLRKREGKATTIEQMAAAYGADIHPTRSAVHALKTKGLITYEKGDYSTIKILAPPSTPATSSAPKAKKAAAARRPSRSRIPHAPRRAESSAPTPAPRSSEDGSKDIFGASPSSRAVIVTEEDLVTLRRCVMVLDAFFARMTTAPTLGQHFTTLVSRMVDPNAPPAPASSPVRECRVCGCTETDCRVCIERTGFPCEWVEQDLCSACVEEVQPRKSKAKRAPAAKAAKEEPKKKPRASRRARPASAAAKAAKEEDLPAPSPSPAPAPPPASKRPKPNGVKTRYFGPEGNRNPLPTPGRAPRPQPALYGEQVDAGDLADGDGDGGDAQVMPEDGARFVVIGLAGDELSRHPDMIVATQAMQRNRDANFVRRLADGKAMTQPKRPAA